MASFFFCIHRRRKHVLGLLYVVPKILSSDQLEKKFKKIIGYDTWLEEENKEDEEGTNLFCEVMENVTRQLKK